jgi:hypothetical protein
MLKGKENYSPVMGKTRRKQKEIKEKITELTI